MGEASYIWLYSSYTHPFTERNEEIFTISQNCLPLAKRKIPQQRTYLYWSRLGNVGNCVMYYCSTAYRTPYRLFNFTTACILMAENGIYERKMTNYSSMAAILKSSGGNTRVCALYTFHVVHVGTCKLVSFLIRRT